LGVRRVKPSAGHAAFYFIMQSYQAGIPASSPLRTLTRAGFVPHTLNDEVNGPMSYQFDEMISAPCRLGILATLVPGEPVSFTDMKAKTSLSDGNLHVQTRKLAEAGYIRIDKSRKGRRTVTRFRITELGRERLRLYVMKLQKILAPAPAAPRPAPRPRRPDDSAVWA
jgi:DNA-binding transcriptional ArsR family regulator